jgi:hypothetical protein
MGNFPKRERFRCRKSQAPRCRSDTWGTRLLGYVWMNPKTIDVNYSFNPEAPVDLRKKFAGKLGVPFEERNLLADFNKI